VSHFKTWWTYLNAVQDVGAVAHAREGAVQAPLRLVHAALRVQGGWDLIDLILISSNRY